MASISNSKFAALGVLATLSALTYDVQAKSKADPAVESKAVQGTQANSLRVLVRKDAQLFERSPASPSSPEISKWTEADQDRQRAFVARLIELGPHWAKIATGRLTGKNAKSCLSPHGQSRRFDLEVFVKKSELVPVIKDKIEQRFKDGTGYTLWPGLPVYRRASEIDLKSRYRVRSARFALELPLSDEQIGLSWRSIPLNAYARGDVEFIGTQPLKVGGQANISVQFKSRFNLAKAVHKTGPTALIEVNDRCVKSTAMTEVKALKKAEFALGLGAGGMGSSLGSLGSRGGPKRRPFVLKAGTVLSWQHGGRAGTVLKDYRVRDRYIKSQTDDKVCFEISLRSGFGRKTPPQLLIACGPKPISKKK